MAARLVLGLQAHDDHPDVTLSVYWSSEGLVPIARAEEIHHSSSKAEVLAVISELAHLFLIPPLDPEHAAKTAHELFDSITTPFPY